MVVVRDVREFCEKVGGRFESYGESLYCNFSVGEGDVLEVRFHPGRETAELVYTESGKIMMEAPLATLKDVHTLQVSGEVRSGAYDDMVHFVIYGPRRCSLKYETDTKMLYLEC